MAMTRAQKIAAATAAASALALPFEGMRQVAYYDPPGILSVCAGHTGPDVVKNKTYTLAECRGLLDKDMTTAVTAVDRCVPNAPDSVLLAFSDAAYNIGPKVACDTHNSTAARLLKAGDWKGACRQLPRWDKSSVMGVMVALPGLTRRRAAESQICLKGLP